MRVRISPVAIGKLKRKRAVRALVAPDAYRSVFDGTFNVVIPLYTKPECNGQTGNSRLAGIIRSGTRKTQRATVTRHLITAMSSQLLVEFFSGETPTMKDAASVRMTRLSPRKLDTGNLWSALKATQDAVAAFLGVNDGPNSPVQWEVNQEVSKVYGVRVEFKQLMCAQSTQA